MLIILLQNTQLNIKINIQLSTYFMGMLFFEPIREKNITFLVCFSYYKNISCKTFK